MTTESRKKNFLAIVVSSLKMSVATFLSRILGLVREQVMAHHFGASGLTDAFLVAYRIPNLLRDLFAEGAFSPAFVPVFAEAKKEGKGRDLLWSTFFLLFFITSIIGILIFYFSDDLIRVFAPTFVEDPFRFELASNLTKYMSPFLLCVSLAALFMGALNSLKVFFVPALAPASLNVVMILSMVFLPSVFVKYGYSDIYALGLGVLLGGILQFLVQLPLLIKKSYGPMVPKKIFNTLSVRIVKRIGPGVIGLAATQINLLVTTILASSIEGAVSWLNYAFRLFQFPVGIFGVSIGNSHLVHFSEALKNGDHDGAKDFLKSSYLFSLFLLVPATFLLIGASEGIVNLIFERGRFDHTDTLKTALLLKCYAISLPFYGIYKIMVPSFYSLDKQKIPIYLTMFSVGINIIICLSFVSKYGEKIFALGTSLTMLINAMGCMFFITRMIHLPKLFFIDKKVLKILLSGVGCYYVTCELANNFYSFHFSLLEKLGSLALVGAAGVLTYGLILFILGEAKILKKVFQKKDLRN